MQQQQQLHYQQQQQCPQLASLDTQLALMQQQLQQQQLQPSSLDTQLALMQQQEQELQQQLHYQQQLQHRQRQQQRRRNSCQLPLGDRERYRLFGSTGNMSSLEAPLEPVLEEVQAQDERMALADIERELTLLMQVGF
jgi:hypothetical protein